MAVCLDEWYPEPVTHAGTACSVTVRQWTLRYVTLCNDILPCGQAECYTCLGVGGNWSFFACYPHEQVPMQLPGFCSPFSGCLFLEYQDTDIVFLCTCSLSADCVSS